MRFLTKTRTFASLLILAMVPGISSAQKQTDTLDCFLVGFNFSTMLSGGERVVGGEKTDILKNPFLNFGVNGFYKTKSNWTFGIEGDLYFGNDNLKNREQRLQGLYTTEGTMIGSGGGDAGIEAFNRGLSLTGNVGKIIPVSSKNVNSGIFCSLGAGFTQSQLIYQINAEEAPQIDGDYALLYDHQQRGLVLAENIGYWFMSNSKTYLNCMVSFEMQQWFTHSTRDYVIDYCQNIFGKDDNRYFTPIYSLKLIWMFPLTGKSDQEYYYH